MADLDRAGDVAVRVAAHLLIALFIRAGSAVIAAFQFSVSQNRTDGDQCRGGGNATFQCVAFRIKNR